MGRITCTEGHILEGQQGFLAVLDNMMVVVVGYTVVAADIVVVAAAVDNQALSLAVMVFVRKVNIQNQSFLDCM